MTEMTKEVKRNAGRIKVAIAGLGNCASSLIQGLYYYKDVKDDSERVNGLMHNVIGKYKISDIEIVAAVDIDARKVGRDVSQATFAKPNCTKIFCKEIPYMGVEVKMGPVLDGVAPHMREYPDKDQTFVISTQEPVDVVEELRNSGAEILICYLPVGSQKAVEYYARAALKAGCGFINAMPIFIVSTKRWENKFRKAGLPCIGDDVKSQLGGTIVHRNLVHLFVTRGVSVTATEQLNIAGNTDFLNMLSPERVKTKLISKFESINSLLPEKLDRNRLFAGPSGYVAFRKDSRVAYINIMGDQFGDIPISLKAELSVEDSPNSAGCVIDAIRLMKLALDRNLSGAILPACAYLMKRPPVQMEDNRAREILEQFIKDGCRNMLIAPNLIQSTVSAGEYYSEVWTNIAGDFVAENQKLGLHSEVLAPEGNYHDAKPFVNLVETGTLKLNGYSSGYKKNLFIPFGVTDRKLKERMIDILSAHPEINIYAINVPPDDEYLERVPNIRRYIGMDEFLLGKRLFNALTSKANLARVIVVRHEDNQYAHDLRTEGIKNRAKSKGIEVFCVGHKDHENIKRILSLGETGAILLGNRATEKILKLKIPGITVPMVTVDSNKRIAAARARKGSDKVILASFIQEGLYGGHFFSLKNNIINPAIVTA